MVKRQKIEGGGICPKCRRKMQRFQHGPNWQPRPSQPYFFRWWDVCKCRHVQHYEEAKQFAEPPVDAEHLERLAHFRTL